MQPGQDVGLQQQDGSKAMERRASAWGWQGQDALGQGSTARRREVFVESLNYLFI